MAQDVTSENNHKAKFYEDDDGQCRVRFRNFQTFNGGRKEGFRSAARLFVGGYLEQWISGYERLGNTEACPFYNKFPCRTNDTSQLAARSFIRRRVHSMLIQ
jgi:hypothetical protein